MKHLTKWKLIAALALMAGVTSCEPKIAPSSEAIQQDSSEATILGTLSEDTIAHKPARIFNKIMYEKQFHTIVIGTVKNCNNDSINSLTLEADSVELLVEVKDNMFTLPNSLVGKQVAVHADVTAAYKNGELYPKVIANGIQVIQLK